MPRTPYRLIVRDDDGPVLINARVFPRLVGTATPLPDAFPTATGGAAAQSFVTNTQGEAQFWTDAYREDIDVQVTDNGGAAYPPGGIAGTFASYIETVQVPAPNGTLVSATDPNEVYIQGIALGGVLDNAAAINAAVAAATTGTTLVLPHGRIKYSGNLSTGGKALTLKGTGSPSARPMGPFGHALWAGVNEQGTVLECTATTGTAITHVGTGAADSVPLNLENLVLKGMGDATRTIAGISVGDATHDVLNGSWRNVFVLNFATGVTATFWEDNKVDNLVIYGCTNGLVLGAASNQNTIDQLNISRCLNAITLTNAFANKFCGGAIQGGDTGGTGVRLLGTSGGNNFDTIYYENAAAAFAIDIAATAHNNRFPSQYINGAGDHIRVASNGNVIDAPQFATNNTVTDTGAGNQLNLRQAGPSVFGFPITVDPLLCTANPVWDAANRAWYWRVKEGGIISKISIQVTTASGNICLGVYRNSGVGQAATPGARVATSGSVACPAAGNGADISLGASVVVFPGDWLAMSVDNGVAAFYGIPTKTYFGTPGGVSGFQAVFPLPVTAAMTNTIGPAYMLAGKA